MSTRTLTGEQVVTFMLMRDDSRTNILRGMTREERVDVLLSMVAAIRREGLTETNLPGGRDPADKKKRRKRMTRVERIKLLLAEEST